MADGDRRPTNQQPAVHWTAGCFFVCTPQSASTKTVDRRRARSENRAGSAFMSKHFEHRRRHSHPRPLRLEPLEQRAMCAGMPFHADYPVRAVYGAIDKPDGSIEVIGTRQGDYPFPIGPVV